MRNLLSGIIRHLSSCDFDVAVMCDTHDIANICCGFKTMNDKHEEVRWLLRWVCTLLDKFNAKSGIFHGWTPSDISTALYGFQRMGIKGSTSSVKSSLMLSDELLELLGNLNVSFLKSEACLDLRHIGRAMYSLNNMGSEYEVVRNVVATLRIKAADFTLLNPEKYNKHNSELLLSKAIYGLRSMSSNHIEVRQMVALLSEILTLKGGRCDMNLQSVNMAMVGISSMSSKHEEVLHLFEILTKIYRTISKKNKVTSHSVGNVLSSLRIFENASRAGTIADKEISLRSDLVKAVAEVVNGVESKGLSLDGVAIPLALRGLSHLSFSDPEVKTILDGLLRAADSTNSSEATLHKNGLFLTPEHCLGALHAFQNTSNVDEITTKWLDFLSDCIRIGICTHPPSISYIVSGYRGIMNMNGDCSVVKKVLKTLYTTINAYDGRQEARMSEGIRLWSSLDISLVINSLQNMNSFDAEVYNTLKALLLKAESGLGFSPDELSLSLFGMRYMSPLQVEVKQTLNMLLSGIKRHQKMDIKDNQVNTFTSRNATTCLYGLRNMSTCFEEVKELLHILKTALLRCTNNFNNQEIGSAYFGMQSMEADDGEVIELLRVINDKFEAMTEPLRPRTVGDILFGLQRFKIGNNTEVERAVAILYKKITKENLNEFDIDVLSRALFGLMCTLREGLQFNHDDYAMLLLSYLLSQSHNLIQRTNDNDLREMTLISFYRSVILLCHNSTEFIPPHTRKMLNELVQLVKPHVSSIDESSFESSMEKRYAFALSALLGQREKGTFEIETGALLHGFSCDIIVRPLLANGQILNIELDGPTHCLPRKKLFCEMRDSYLENACNTRIVRVDLCHYTDHDENMMCETLASKIRI